MASSRNRIVLQLDPRIALEAILLNRLEITPKARQQEWLRGLLVQGFRVECQALRDVPGVAKTESGMNFSDWLTGDPTRQAVLPKLKRKKRGEQEAVAPTEAEGVHNATKPFAQLSRVIG